MSVFYKFKAQNNQNWESLPIDGSVILVDELRKKIVLHKKLKAVNRVSPYLEIVDAVNNQSSFDRLLSSFSYLLVLSNDATVRSNQQVIIRLLPGYVSHVPVLQTEVKQRTNIKTVPQQVVFVSKIRYVVTHRFVLNTSLNKLNFNFVFLDFC